MNRWDALKRLAEQWVADSDSPDAGLSGDRLARGALAVIAERDKLREAMQVCVQEILSLSARTPHTQSTEAALAQARQALAEAQEGKAE